MKILQIIIVYLIILIINNNAYAELTTSEIAKKYSPSVVTIVVLDENDQPIRFGSGFFINKKGNIATNHHVLEGGSKAIIKTIKDEKGNVIEIIKDDPKLDLIVAKTSLKNTKPLPLHDSDKITVGEDIIAIGNPAGLEGTVSKGIISGIRKKDEIKLIQITAPISPGSSGGPVFNLSGKVIGVATAYLEYGQSLNFAMPINYLRNLKTKKIQLASLPKTKQTERKLLKDKSKLEVFDIHYIDSSYSLDLKGVYFAVKNKSEYPIKNIKLFFIYKTINNEILSYSTMMIKKTILPKLALQFSHDHIVKYFFKKREVKQINGKSRIYKITYDDGTIRYTNEPPAQSGIAKIHILDYEIDSRSVLLPKDLIDEIDPVKEKQK